MKRYHVAGIVITVLTLLLSPLPVGGTVAVETTKNVYTGSGTTGPFPYSFKIWAATELTVIKTLISTGTETTLVLNTDYTVTGVGVTGGGNVNLTSVLSSSYTLTILRNMQYLQSQNFTPGAIAATPLNNSLDKLEHQIQQLYEKSGRSWQLPRDWTTPLDMYLKPSANRLIGWNSLGTGLLNYDTTTATIANFDHLGNHADSICQAVTDLGSAPTTLLVSIAAIETDNCTVPSTLNLFITRNGSINPASGVGIEIDNPSQIIAGAYQIKNGSGRIYFTNPGQVLPQWWGCVADDTTDCAPYLRNAAASLPTTGHKGGKIYVPAGWYKILRGDGTADNDTILTDNVEVYGDGSATVFNTLPKSGTLTDSAYGSEWNVFQATGRNHITIRDMSFRGVLTPVVLNQCDNVTVSGIHDDGLLGNASAYLRGYTIYMNEVDNINITKSTFINDQYPIYIVGSYNSGTQICSTWSDNVRVENNHFENTATTFTALWPTSVYPVCAKSVIVNGNTFKNIYSSLAYGTPATGMGYAVYEGDGKEAGQNGNPTSLIVTNNQMWFTGNSNRRAMGVFSYFAAHLQASNNVIQSTAAGGLYYGIYRLSARNAYTTADIQSNIIENDNLTMGTGIVVANLNTDEDAFSANVSNNVITGGSVGISVADNTKNAIVGNNKISYSNDGIQVYSENTLTDHLVDNIINGNSLFEIQRTAIRIVPYAMNTTIINNTVIDSNTSNDATEAKSAIYLGNSQGSVIRGNRIINRVDGPGHVEYGIVNTASANGRILADIVEDNTFENVANSYSGFWTSTNMPSNGILGLGQGRCIKNTDRFATITVSYPESWCVDSIGTFDLDANATAGDATITISAHASYGTIAPGDIIVITAHEDYVNNFDWGQNSTWFATTASVAAVTGDNTIDLRDPIRAGHGPFSSATAHVTVARLQIGPKIGQYLSYTNLTDDGNLTDARIGGKWITDFYDNALATDNITISLGDSSKFHSGRSLKVIQKSDTYTITLNPGTDAFYNYGCSAATNLRLPPKTGTYDGSLTATLERIDVAGNYGWRIYDVSGVVPNCVGEDPKGPASGALLDDNATAINRTGGSSRKVPTTHGLVDYVDLKMADATSYWNIDNATEVRRYLGLQDSGIFGEFDNNTEAQRLLGLQDSTMFGRFDNSTEAQRLLGLQDATMFGRYDNSTEAQRLLGLQDSTMFGRFDNATEARRLLGAGTSSTPDNSTVQGERLGGTGQNSQGWTGWAYVTAGVWSAKTVDQVLALLYDSNATKAARILLNADGNASKCIHGDGTWTTCNP